MTGVCSLCPVGPGPAYGPLCPPRRAEEGWPFAPGCKEHITFSLPDRAAFWGPLCQMVGDG